MPLRRRTAKKTKASKPRAPRGRRKKSAEEIRSPELKIEETKYYAGPAIQKFVEDLPAGRQEKPFELPAGYSDNRIVAMVRDPYWIFAYWEVNQRRKDEIKEQIGEAEFNQSRETLRTHDTESWNFFDLEVTGGATNWYIKVPAPARTYCVEIGYKTKDGRFIVAVRSNFVTTPRDRMSEVIDEEWMTLDWEKMYRLSGGFKTRRGSEEITELMKKRLEQEAGSGWLFK